MTRTVRFYGEVSKSLMCLVNLLKRSKVDYEIRPLLANIRGGIVWKTKHMEIKLYFLKDELHKDMYLKVYGNREKSGG